MLSPFLKWAGGKRWLISSDQFLAPERYDRYIEPFLGGGAMFFHLQPKRALLCDVNRELIELYEIVRDDPNGLLEHLKSHQSHHGETHYYKMRAHIPATPLERAARTLYLNRTCWNGLYRVNQKGEFNVPIGTKTRVIFDGESFLDSSRALKSADLRCDDFEATLQMATAGDFVFIDPPYTVKHNLNGFLKYNEKIFNWEDQTRLREAVRGAIGRGASLTITNADHESVRELYRDICEYRQLSRASVLSGNSKGRGPTTEAMFTANIPRWR